MSGADVLQAAVNEWAAALRQQERLAWATTDEDIQAFARASKRFGAAEAALLRLATPQEKEDTL